MVTPTPLSGFPEFLPEHRIVEQQVLDELRRTFELWGFASIETRAVEPLTQLLRKGEIDKEVYAVRRLHADADDVDTLALHFDLTVPFARYVLENAGKLKFPFRRYQIQKAWRGERPQDGRYREFTQADVDIVGAGSLAFHHDVEVASAMAAALRRLPLPPLTVQVNNRRLLEGFFLGLGIVDTGAVMRAVDKLDKLPAEAVQQLLVSSAGVNVETANRCLALAAVNGSADDVVAGVRELGVVHELLDQGLEELVAVLSGAARHSDDQVWVVGDLRIARGLDYYTGTVFETRMAGFEHLGSVCSGGRYESLASDGNAFYPGVGISLGVTRLLAPLFARGLLRASRSVPSAVLVAVMAESRRGVADDVAARLRARGIACEVSADDAKFGRQIRTADRRGIPFVWFTPADDDGTHQVKDIRSGDQAEADPDTWSPPELDLAPSVVSSWPA